MDPTFEAVSDCIGLVTSSVEENDNDLLLPSLEEMGPNKAWDEDYISPAPSPNLDYESSFHDDIPGRSLIATASEYLQNEYDVDDGLAADGIRGEAGVVGLNNLGNTCFMSAGVQCLMATAPIVVSLVKIHPSFPDQSSDIMLCLAELARTMWSARHVNLPPTRFKATLATRYPQFNDYRQHDCQEFLALLLDALHEQMNTAHKKNSPSNSKTFKPPNNKQPNLEITDYQSTSFAKEELMPVELKMNHTAAEVLNNNSPTAIGCAMAGQCEKIFAAETASAVDGGEGRPKMTINNLFNGGESGTSQYALDDILKTPKTSNVNLLVTEGEANNEIRFDSDKYPKIDTGRRSKNSFQLFENNTSGKRCKSTVVRFSSGEEFKEGLDNLKNLKRAKLHSKMDDDKNVKLEVERQFKQADLFLLLDKNERMESERKECQASLSSRVSGVMSLNNAPELNIKFNQSAEPDADAHWRSHLEANRSVVIDTFQGQFKSTVVCSYCRFVSVTYEPFMYLSVPLPNALQKPIKVTYVSEPSTEPSVFTLELNRYDDVKFLKKRVLEKIEDKPGQLIIAEVLDHHVAKILDEDYLVKHLNVSERDIYAFKVPAQFNGESEQTDEEETGDKSCAICFEEKQTKRHDGCPCNICDDCLTRWCNHSGSDTVECPTCKNKIKPESFVTSLKPDDQTIRFVFVPLLFRLDSLGDGNNNQKSVVLFGHPRIICVPNICSSEKLYEIVNESNPFRSSSPKLLLVDGKGHNCSRCIYTTHCRGCEVPTSDSEIHLRKNDSLALTFSSMPAAVFEEPCLKDKLEKFEQKSLTIYDCIEAFSKSEVLDGNNPWYCTKCQEPRCATKSLTVWRYPDYLIVYLKRFVFHDGQSTKLEEKVIFPLNDLHFPSVDLTYDLYACVCHVGGASSGHYTTYAQHPYTGEWHYFNDSSVLKRAPQDEDFSKAYILFYRKQGVQIPRLDLDNSGRF